MTDDATINALVAEHVLGIERQHPSVTWPSGFVLSTQPDACNSGDVMLRVIEAMRAKGWNGLELRFDPSIVGDEQWLAIFHRGQNWEDCEGHTAGRAVALAALRALGVEVPA